MNPDAPNRLDPQMRRIAFVIVLGTVMGILDTTVINVALHDLAEDFGSTLDTIQWSVTAYMLAVAATLPASGWAARRVGSKRLYVIAICLFTVGSALCGLAWSAESLIGFRVLQGLGGGLVLPVGQMILVRAAGPKALPRVMSAIGIPIVLGPILGPVLGGLLLDHAGWRWIFFINVPISVVAVVAAVRMLPSDRGEDAGRLDFAGLVLASAGFAAVTFGLAKTATSASLLAPSVVVPVLVGLALIAVFVLRALQISYPLVDIRLFANRGYASAAMTGFFLAAAFYGALILMPLYFQTSRGESALMAGLLLAPQGIGTGVGMRVSARATERWGAGRTALVGVLLVLVSTVPFLSLSAEMSYLVISLAMLARGVGTGLSMMPAMTAAYAHLRPDQVSHATPALNTLQRLGGSMGAALITVVLQHNLASGTSSAVDTAHAFAVTNWTVIALTAVVIVPTILLARNDRRIGTARDAPPVAVVAETA